MYANHVHEQAWGNYSFSPIESDRGLGFLVGGISIRSRVGCWQTGCNSTSASHLIIKITIKLKRLQALLVQRKMMETWCCPPSNVCNTLTNNSWSRQIYTSLSNRHIVKLNNYSTLIEQRNFLGILKLSLCLIREFDVYIRGLRGTLIRFVSLRAVIYFKTFNKSLNKARVLYL